MLIKIKCHNRIISLLKKASPVWKRRQQSKEVQTSFTLDAKAIFKNRTLVWGKLKVQNLSNSRFRTTDSIETSLQQISNPKSSKMNRLNSELFLVVLRKTCWSRKIAKSSRSSKHSKIWINSSAPWHDLIHQRMFLSLTKTLYRSEEDKLSCHRHKLTKTFVIRPPKTIKD